ncbi:xanthine dehydrogenase family protein molybdopterin-binding subunit [Clostridium disporicum]|uniref:Aldehyde oxidase and xanthine dehydrogenase molybdopterin binding protein n=1 Tax=Clostridium disporicum TaxID=84024 RepID=A0A173ZD97_9CLOT|nr:molybdopterin cofactor-binding domain-containing protein [Clostridium disporicum]CUN74362.1 aldehyde oxidase and xanthine dehydrogenase molybdopterin binding protein [Clostridium disporicum]
MKYVNKSIRKSDSMSLLTGKPVYTEDLAPKNCLVVKLLRSPHAHALIESIDTTVAMKVPGIECILTYEDMPKSRFTTAGQSYPEPSPYDRLILDRRLRCVGDPVAIVAGENEKAVNKAMKLIKVKYEVLEAVLDFRNAKDNNILVHPEKDFKALCDVGADNKRNLCSTGGFEHGNLEEELKNCDIIIEETYHTKANNQAMMETFRTFTELDIYGRLNITSATQVPFHVRRIIANALEIPKSKVRVVKPRIGGGFGAKQSAVSEVYPAIVTMKTGKPAMLIFSRKESMTNGSPRHEMEITVRLGANKDGIIKAIEINTLSNAGAYGEHGPTTVGLSAHKSMPLYSTPRAYKFNYDVVYTNTMGAGAYRGYGATQGIFALESAVNELAAKLNMDPIKLRELNMVKEGDVMPAYYGEIANSCALDRCLEKAKNMIDWDNKYPARDMGNGKIRSVGIAMAMQGSGISNIDTAAVEIKLNDDGFYTLMIGASDMGTGCDTILAQIAADCLNCEVENIVVHGVDTDQSPYDTGSYASSTTYVTGGAVIKTCETLKVRILEEASKILECPIGNLDFDGKSIHSYEDDKEISLVDLANRCLVGGSKTISASESHYSKTSPPPFMVGAVEIEIDKLTGKLDIIDYVAVVDCGTMINPNLAKIQAEGGIVQGIGMALYEDISYDFKGRMRNDSFMQYKIPSRLDVGNIRVEFESSYEPTGPFGAKSIGEIVINTPSPALAHAVYNATKVNIRTLPITAEKIAMGMMENED